LLIDTDEKRTTTANSGLAKGGVSCFVERFVQGPTFVLRMNICAKNPALRQAAKRYGRLKDPTHLHNYQNMVT
jgi:hypothetical protein